MKKTLLSIALLPLLVLSIAHAQVPANTAVLTWGAVTARTDGSPLGGTATYQVYQGLQGATKAKAGVPVTTLTSTISAGLAGGKTYCWQVSTVVGAEESALSNEACKTFPQAPVQAPTLQVQ
jgi:hypothetical protein